MTRPTLTLSIPDSILVGAAFEATIVASNPTDAAIQTVSPASEEVVALRLTPTEALPQRRLTAETTSDVPEDDDGGPPGADDDDGGPPGADDDEDEDNTANAETDSPDDTPFYFVLSERQKREAMAPDDRVMLPPPEMVDLAPGAEQSYDTAPNDLMVEPIPAGSYAVSGILAGPVPAFETQPHALDIQRLDAQALVACTHISGAALLVAYAHRDASGTATVYQHVTGPDAQMGPGHVRAKASQIDSIAQTCGSDEMQIGPSWVAWIENDTFRADLAERGVGYGTVEAPLRDVTLAPTGWQDGNDGTFFAFGQNGQIMLVSAVLGDADAPEVKRLDLPITGDVLDMEVGRTEAGEFTLIVVMADAGSTKADLFTVDPMFREVTEHRHLVSVPQSFARLAVTRHAHQIEHVHILSEADDQPDLKAYKVTLQTVSLNDPDTAVETNLTPQNRPDALYLSSDGSARVHVLARDNRSLYALNGDTARLITPNLSVPAPPIILLLHNDIPFALVADPDWGLVFIPLT